MPTTHASPDAERTARRWLRLPLALLIALHGLVLFAGFFAPYSFREQYRDFPRAEPTTMRFADASGAVSLRPFVAAPDGTWVPVRFLVPGAEYRWLGVVRARLHLFGVAEPAKLFLLGTDELGRDYFSRLVYGGRLSLTAGLLAAFLATGLGSLLGTLAGYVGRRLDAIIMWTSDVFLSLPWLYLLLAARAFLPLDLEPGTAFLTLVLLLGVLGWAGPMRIVRAVVLSVKQRDFVTAARSAGAGHAHVLGRHVLPAALGAMATQAGVLVPAYMLAEVTLSYVGLGVGEPVPSWGNLLAELPRAQALTSQPWLLTPALLVVAVGWLYHAALAAPKTRGRTPHL